MSYIFYTLFQSTIDAMLLIWDIHLTTKRSEPILSSLRKYFSEHDDREVVFLGDFVYHFNYDRKALLGIYEIFLDLYKEWRTVIVLAWNHDRLQNSFVFEEAKKAFDIFLEAGVVAEHGWTIHFVTTPMFLTLWGQQCLLYPYHIPEQTEYSCTHFDELLNSTHQQEQRSGRANSKLYDMIEQWKETKWTQKYLTVFHHWYIAWQAFPGQFAKFGYKNPALSKEFLDDQDLRLVSWHLHQPFVFQNYLCVGSIRHTSPLEINQCKFLYQRDIQKDIVHAEPFHINPYIRIEWWDQRVDKQNLEEFFAEQYVEQISHLEWWLRNVVAWKRKDVSLKTATLTIISDVWYEHIDTLVDIQLREQCRDVKIKQQTKMLPALVELMDTSSKELDLRLGDWKKLLTQFLEQKYGESSWTYIKILNELEVV